MQRNHILMTGILAGFGLSACGDSGGDGIGNGGDPTDVTIVSFTASPESVTAGEPVTLSWNVRNATSIILEETTRGEQLFAGGENQLQESFTIDRLELDSTFRLIAENDTDRKEQEVTVTISGLQVAEFSASPTSLRSGSTTVLTWRVVGATVQSLEILDEDGNVPNDAGGNPIDPLVANEGSVEVLVIGDAGVDDDTETYTLNVAGGGLQTSRDVEVSVEVPLPIIDAFTTAGLSNTVVFGQTVTARWRVRNTDRVRVLFDGQLCGEDDRVNAGSDPVEGQNRCQNFPVTEATHTLRIEAFNTNTPEPSDAVVEEITIMGTAPVSINAFELDPSTYWEGSVDVTASWDVAVANRVELQRLVDPAQDIWETVSAAPTDPVSSYDFAATGGDLIDFRIRARLVEEVDGDLVTIDSETAVATLTGDFNEPEPNDGRTNALEIQPKNYGLNHRATIDGLDDEDWFYIDVPEGGRVFAQVGIDEFDLDGLSLTCALDTQLEFLSETDSLGTVTGNLFDGIVPGADTTCAEMIGTRHPFALNLPAGRYYLRVTGQNAAVGEYQLQVNVTSPVPEDPLTGSVPRNGPSWDVVDINVVSMPFLDPAETIPLSALPFWVREFYILNAHGIQDPFPMSNFPWFAGGSLSARIVPQVAHVTDYSQEMQAGFQALGLPINSGFVRQDLGIEPPGNGAIQNAIVLGYTVIPKTTTATGTSADTFLTNTPNLPVLRWNLFPFRTDEVTFGKVFEEALWDEVDNRMGNPVEYVIHPNDSQDLFDGATHRHFLHVFGANLFDPPAEPEDASGNYIWKVRIRDATDAGYDIEVPISNVP